MTIANSHIHPPRGLSRLLWRLPIGLYRAHLGWLLTSHFLLLQHIGRKSRQARYAVLEVIQRDKANDVYYIAAGFGSSSDWYQNLLKTPQAKIQSGWREGDGMAEGVSIEMAETISMG